MNVLVPVLKVAAFVAAMLALTFWVMPWLTDGQPNCHPTAYGESSCGP